MRAAAGVVVVAWLGPAAWLALYYFVRLRGNP